MKNMEKFALIEDVAKNYKRKFSNKNTPIDIWWDLIHSDIDSVRIKQTLRQIYETNLPTLGEIVFTSICQCKCQHCIYPSNYSEFNNCLSSEQWKRIIKNVYDNLGIRVFIHNGRSLDDTGIEVLKWMRQELTDAQIGIVDNGISLIPYLDELPDIQPDWIDISIDGMEKEHDLQRNREGFFKKTLSTITYLKQKDSAPKINTLICLTNINKDSIIDLIEFMNQQGFKNFFISPISTFKDYGPSEELRVSGIDLAGFIKNLYASLYKFQDTWIEFNIFDVEYLKGCKTLYPELWYRFGRAQKCLSYKKPLNDNEFYINYYPLSLHGIREFTINCNGDVIFPQAMRKGKISDRDVIGNLLKINVAEVIRRLREFSLGFYVEAFLAERNYIGGN